MRRKIVILVLTLLLAMALTACVTQQKVAIAAATPKATVVATPIPTPQPTPQPTPEPTPEPGPYGDGMYVVQIYDNAYPEQIDLNFKHNRSNQERFVDYVVVLQDGHIYAEMDIESEQLLQADSSDRYETSAKLDLQDEQISAWYRVHWTKTIEDVETDFVGYIQGSIAVYRTFQLNIAYQDVLTMAKEIDNGVYTYVTNRKNSVSSKSQDDIPDTGLTEEFGKPVDQFGTLKDQSAPVFKNIDRTGEFRYAADGTMVNVLGYEGDMAKVYLPQYQEEFYIHKEYLKSSYTKDDIFVKKLYDAVVIDRTNQNIMFFELNRETDKFELLSMSYVSTGTSSQFADPTPLGFFAVQKVQGYFVYDFDDRPGVEAGRAPYAIRFSGGAYIHGVPINYTKDELGNIVIPRQRESHPCLGVSPESHMCVRNYTTHAKFLLNRVDVGRAIVIVIE